MATPAQRTNTWILDEWYDQAVAGTTGGYNSNLLSLYSWGYNTNGQLGQNNKTNYSSPVQIPGSWLASDGAAVNPVDMETGAGYNVAGSLKSN